MSAGAMGARRGRSWPFVGRAEEVRTVVGLLADDGCGGVMVAGGSGVGKSRVVLEALAALRASAPDTAVEWAVGTPPASGISFGATASWFEQPIGEPAGSAAGRLFPALAAELARRAAGRPLVVAVDDAHHLDSSSALLLHHLAVTETAKVLVTVRHGELVPETILGLWKDGRVERVDLHPFDEDGTADALRAALGGPVDDALVRALWRVSAGNLFYLRELTVAAEEAGVIRQHRGRWLLLGPLPTSPTVADLVQARIGCRGEAEDRALDLVALGEPLALRVLEELVAPSTMAALESAGLVVVDRDGRRQAVRLAHPAYGEVLRARCGVVRARLLAGELARAMERLGLRRGSDRLRHAVLQLDSGGRCDPEDARSAARAALHAGDPALAERLAQAACAADPTDVPATFALVEALLRQQRPQECLTVLDRVPPLAEPEETLVRRSRAFLLWWAFGQADEAVAELDRIEASAVHHESRLLVRSTRAALLCHRGAVAESLRLTDEVLAGRPSPLLWWEATQRRAFCLAMMGRSGAALAALAEGGETVLRSDPLAPPRVELGEAAVAMASFGGGDLQSMDAIAERARRDGLSLGNLPLRRLGIAGLGVVAMRRGRLVEATERFEDAVSLLEPSDTDGTQALVVAFAARAAALSGDVARAQRLLQEWRRAAHPLIDWFSPLLDHAEVVCRAAAGQRRLAAELLAEAVAKARRRGQTVFELDLLLDGCLLDVAPASAGRLAQVAGGCEGPLPELAGAFAGALATGSVADLLAVAVTAEGQGMLLFAAQTAAAAAVAARRAGDGAGHGRAVERCRRVLDGCTGVGEWVVEGRLVDGPLTPREREVAVLVASGCSNRDVAGQLSVSVRTVESHLERIFTKLAVRRRSELSELLAPGPWATPLGAASSEAVPQAR